jgi:Asp-tRNA(Asn)/Glu-tRNA(Gln) amidotransferase A subunit family amidase
MRSYLAHASQFASGAESPRDFLEACLANLNTWEPKVGAFVNLSIEARGKRRPRDRALARGRSAVSDRRHADRHQGHHRDCRHADRDGLALFAGWRSQKDAASVAALRQAGAVILGKTVTTEFAASEPRGTRNPWNLEHTPGGSSSGSAAAVAAGIISAGLGTQVIGSTIRPASFCGCVGFKPTVGALNREGSHDYQSQSCTGILAATLPDAWQVAYEIAQRVGGDAGTPGLIGPERAPEPVKPRRLAFLETSGWAVASEAAKASIQNTLQRLSEAGVEIRTSADDADVSAIETELAEAFTLSNRINSFETRWFIDGCAERDASLLSQSMRDRLEQARGMTLADYRGWLKERTSVRALYAELADTCDACVTLSAPGPRRKVCRRPAIRNSRFPPRCSAFRLCRCRCSCSTACRWDCRSWAMPMGTPMPSPSAPGS